MAICDRCSTGIDQGDGYLTYSDASVQIYEGAPSLDGGLEVGCLFLCEECAKSIYTDANFSKAQPAAIEIDPSHGGELTTQLRQAMTAVNDASLVIIAKKQGLSPQQALDQARRLAQEWWTDKESATRKVTALAKEAGGGTAPTAEAPAGKAPRQKRWWQFWK